MACFCRQRKITSEEHLYNIGKYVTDQKYDSKTKRERLSQTAREMDKFLSERIMCYNCRNIYTIKENKIILECAACEKMFCCGVGGECMGRECRVMVGDKVCRQRYCSKCIKRKIVDKKIILYCEKCY